MHVNFNDQHHIFYHNLFSLVFIASEIQCLSVCHILRIQLEYAERDLRSDDNFLHSLKTRDRSNCVTSPAACQHLCLKGPIPWTSYNQFSSWACRLLVEMCEICPGDYPISKCKLPTESYCMMHINKIGLKLYANINSLNVHVTP